MLSKEEKAAARATAVRLYEKAGVVLTDSEKENMEVADFGQGDLKNTGLGIVTYVNTERVCAKEMVLFPYQTCPEHRHIGAGGMPGKEETFRCRYGLVRLYVEGEHTAVDPRSPAGVYTVFREIVLRPGEQYTIYPDTKHWFQAGEDGAVISEFSTKSTDETDVFTDPSIKRMEA
ncbi:MAG: D-lyxose/D-mannose family sugar isomerase [Oscillospiraceae bacterium]|nr:D-lyxose/D-mannose family sugar isomerase [Oscillospiraceae bacterium]